jgi:hypothetical protein
MIRSCVFLLSCLGFFLGQPVTAQIMASEKGEVKQTVDGTEITVRYSRPSLRGREDILGGEVPDSVLWTPGANNATTLEVSKDFTLEGLAVPAGTYTMWMVILDGAWEVILDPRDEIWHLPHPARSDSQFVVSAMPDTMASRIETLQFSFPEVRPDGATLQFRWENTLLDLSLGVTPSRVLTVPEEVAAQYLGHYDVEVMANEDWQSEGHEFQFEMSLDDGYLGGAMKVFPDWPADVFYFAPAADHVFNLMYTINGSVAGVWGDMFIEFSLDQDGRPVSFDARTGEEDVLFMRGVRASDR